MKNSMINGARFWMILVAFVLSFAIYSCEEDENLDLDGTREIVGYLVDGQGIAIPNTTVIARTIDQKTEVIAKKRGASLQGEEFTFLDSASTDENGKFLLKAIPVDPETVYISIENDQYDIVNKLLSDFNRPVEGDEYWYVSVERKEDCQTNLKLLFTETKQDGQNNKYTPSEDMRITLSSQDGQVIQLFPQRSDKFSDLIIDGQLSYDDVCPGKYTLNVTRDSYKPIEDVIIIEEGRENPTLTKIYNLVYTGLNEGDCCNNVIYIAAIDEAGNSFKANYVINYEGVHDVEPMADVLNGDLNLTDICNGVYIAKISAMGYKTVQMSDTLVCNDTALFIAQMSPIEDEDCCYGSLVLNLLDKDNMNQYVVGAAITILDKSGNIVGEYESEAGPFKLDSICEGSYSVVISHKDYPPTRTIIVDIECDELTEEEVTMKDPSDCCKGSISLLPRDSTDNDVVNGAEFTLFKDGVKLTSGKVENNLAVLFEGLCDGKYKVVFNHPKFGEKIYYIELDCNEQYEDDFFVNVDDCCKGGLAIMLPGEPHRNYDAHIIIKQEDRVVLEGKMNKRDTTWNASLCEGEYTVIIQVEGFQRIEREVTIKCDDMTVIDPELKEEDCCKGVFNIQLTDSTSSPVNPISDAVVIIKKDGKVVEDPKLNDRGEASVELCQGHYVVIIEAKGFERIEHEFEIKCNEDTMFIPNMVESDDCCTGKIILNLFDKETGERLNHASAKLRFKNDVIRDQKTENGRLAWEELCEGPYSVFIEIEGYDDIEMMIEVKCDEIYEENVSATEEDCCTGELTVKLRYDDRWLEGATVIIKQDDREVSQYVSSNDSWSKDLCQGEYTMIVEAKGFKRIEKKLEIKCDEDIVFAPEFEKKDDCCDATLKFTVKDDDGNALDSAEVRVYLSDKKVHYAHSNKDGLVTFANVCKGDDYSFSVSKEGFNGAEREMEDIDCGDTHTYEVTLEEASDCCDATLKFTVTDDNGDAVKDAEVKVYIGSDKQHYGKTDAHGVIEFDEVCEGTRYTYEVEKDGFKEKEGGLFTINCKDSPSINVQLESDTKCCDATLKFTVTDDNGDALKDANVKVYLSDTKVHYGKTDAHGVIEFDEVCEGSDYVYSVELSGYSEKEAEMDDIDCQDSQSYNVELESDDCCEATVKAIVVDKNTRETIEGATVKLYLDGQLITYGDTDSDGIFKTDADLCQGDYVVKIYKTGYTTQEHDWNIDECEVHQETFQME